MSYELLVNNNICVITSDEDILINDYYWDTLVSHWENVGYLLMCGYADKEENVISSTVGTTSPITTSRKIIAYHGDDDIDLPMIDFLGMEDFIGIENDNRKIVQAQQYAIDNKEMSILNQLKNAWLDGFKNSQDISFSLKDMERMFFEGVKCSSEKDLNRYFSSYIKKFKEHYFIYKCNVEIMDDIVRVLDIESKSK